MPDPIGQISLSRWAARLLEAHPALAAELSAPGAFSADEMRNALEGSRADDEAALKRRLRELRRRVLLRTMARDLASDMRHRAGLAEVCRTMSRLAELSIGAALEWIGEP